MNRITLTGMIESEVARNSCQHEKPIQSTQDYFPFGSLLPGRGVDQAEYKYGFNSKENDNEVYGDANFQDYGMRMYDTRVGRFVSVDPMSNSFPWISPFAHTSNSPLYFIDPDGGHNIVYLIDQQPKGRKKVSAQEVANKANANFKALGLETRVVVYDPKKYGGEFNPKYMEQTDAVAVLGSAEDVKKYSRDNKIETSHASIQPGYAGFSDDPKNPETTIERSRLILINSDVLVESGERLNNTPATDVAAYCINHGFGHTQGVGDMKSPTNSFMTEGFTLVNFGTLSNPLKNLNHVISEGNNSEPTRQIIDKITGGNPYRNNNSDNYNMWRDIVNQIEKSK